VLRARVPGSGGVVHGCRTLRLPGGRAPAAVLPWSFYFLFWGYRSIANGSCPCGWAAMTELGVVPGLLFPAALSVAAASEARGPFGPRH
jgi:hypothetical protein